VNIKLVAVGVLALGSVACQAAPARLAGRWVLLSGGAPVAVGQADAPEAGGPLRLVPGSPAAGACLAAQEYVQMFGPVCPHDPEGGPPGSDVDVRWYCQGQLAVRVRLERCPNAARLRVVELAVATAPER
jgi:hypothetical protein